MTFDARQVARARPAAVAVHDHRHVAGKAAEIDLLEEGPFDGPRLREFAQIDHRISDVSTQCPKASNLLPAPSTALRGTPARARVRVPPVLIFLVRQIGRASCRERGDISVVAVSLKKKRE